MRRWAMMLIVGMAVSSMLAVPAYKGWQTQTQADGSTITLRQVGDEFYHYWETTDGKLAVEQADGSFIVKDEPLPTKEEFKARRERARATQMAVSNNGPHKMKQVGSTPNLAPKGVVILVNFSNSTMASSHTKTKFNNMCNAASGACTANAYNGKNYGSAAQYFSDQSNGTYRPQFDIFGPVTLTHNVKYYGEQGYSSYTEKTENDLYLADFVIDAVLAAENAGCDFSQYDSDNDGWVDFVYFIYAGKGQAAGGTSETIWPHNWSLTSALYTGFTHGTSGYYVNSNYDYNLLQVDGVCIDNYACSSELDYNGDLGGIGTLCHEFGHVMGLPDLYDIEYGTVYENNLTPGEWDIMDGGSYNGGMHCPPNYDPWEKAFFGWVTPVNLGNTGSNNTLYANGSSNYNVYQVTSSGSYVGPTDSGERYYLENRQQTGWDEYIPSHGFVAWRVNYDADIWTSNAPNASSSSGTPRFTVDAYGVSSWEKVSGKPVTDIQESSSIVTFKYKGGKQEPDPAWEGWSYYDDGTPVTTIGTNGNAFWWGIMIPANSNSNDQLTKVAVYEATQYSTQSITIDIYSGGSTPAAGTKIYTQTVSPSGETGWHVITLSNAVQYDNTKNLWIILSEGTDTYPAVACVNTGDPNGRWVSTDGNEWVDITSYTDLDYTWMIRALTEKSSTPDPHDWTGWSYYDDGTRVEGIGTNGGEFYWAIMFPANSQSKNMLTKVAVYETTQYNTQPITIDIYSGGSTPTQGTKLYTQTVNPTGEEGFHIITLSSPVTFDKSKNLWIAFKEFYDTYPANVSNNTGDPNGRWSSENGTDWFDLASINLNYTYMIRAYFETSTTPPDKPDWTDWVYYDNGNYVDGVGNNGGTFYWGIMFPASSLSNNKLSKIALYETPTSNTQPIKITIYSGGDMPETMNKIYSETVDPAGVEGYHIINLKTPVTFNRNKNLWITFKEGNDTKPALVCANTGDPNGRWVSENGISWYDLASRNKNYTFMVRAYIGNNPEGIEEIFDGVEGSHKVIHNGHLFILRDGKIYDVLGTKVH